MVFYKWSNIPEEAKPKVKEAVENYDLEKLLDFYYEFDLGIRKYCCGFDGMHDHFKTAIANGEI